MAPKLEKAAPKAIKRKSTPAKQDDEVETVDKKAQSNFSTQMNNAAKAGQLTADQEAVWSKYKTLGRFDQDKKDLIAQWKMDKSCKWMQHFSNSKEKIASVECESVHGWGTRHPVIMNYI